MSPNTVRPDVSLEDFRARAEAFLRAHPTTVLVTVDLGFNDLVACRETELGDFVTGTYLAKVQREVDLVRLVMERPGAVGGHSIRLRKTIELSAGSPSLIIHYQLEDLPPGTLNSILKQAGLK